MRNRRLPLFYCAALAALLVLMAAALCAGAVRVSPAVLWGLLRGERAGAAYKIVRFVRLPRVAAAVLCGAALAASGAIVQSVLRNPLGSPTVLGMNAGACLSVLLCASFVPFGANVLPLAAFAGAFVTLLLVCALGNKAGGSRSSVLLAGIAANTFCTAAADALTVLFPDTIYGRAAFKIGSLAGVQFAALAPAALVIALAAGAAFFLRNELDILALGDETARSLGLSVGAVRYAALVLAALLCGAGISFAGLVGFVGLVVPHCARVLVGNEMRHLLPASLLLGAVLVLLCDLAGRVAFAPFELPVGILLALVGGPFFVALLLKKKDARHD